MRPGAHHRLQQPRPVHEHDVQRAGFVRDLEKERPCGGDTATLRQVFDQGMIRHQHRKFAATLRLSDQTVAVQRRIGRALQGQLVKRLLIVRTPDALGRTDPRKGADQYKSLTKGLRRAITHKAPLALTSALRLKGSHENASPITAR